VKQQGAAVITPDLSSQDMHRVGGWKGCPWVGDPVGTGVPTAHQHHCWLLLVEVVAAVLGGGTHALVTHV
jgi:hypothetical protein